jgi:branched-chain amino acid transport system substrate-binding protein
VYNTYMLARSTGGSIVDAGGKKWFFINPNYLFGQQLREDTSRIVTQMGGTVAGGVSYPFPETVDFSSFLLQAQASAPDVIALCSGGDDTVNLIKQAREFGLMPRIKMAGMLLLITNVFALGLVEAQGLLLSSCFYWDLNEKTRSFTAKVRPRVNIPPNMQQAGDYSATLHYLKTVADMGATQAKLSGAATVARMKAIPTNDNCFGVGRIREDGRKIHPVYLFEVKKPSESTGPWDLLKVVATTPAKQAFEPPRQGGCLL